MVSELSDLVYFLFTTFAHTMTMLPIINKLKIFSYQRPTAYRYCSGPERSGGMLSSRPKKCRYAIPAHTVSLRALVEADQTSPAVPSRHAVSRSHAVSRKCHADDTQLYGFCQPSDVNAIADRVSACFDEVLDTGQPAAGEPIKD